MDGTKLSSFIIFKGGEGGGVIWKFIGDNFPQDSVNTVQDKAWIDRRVFWSRMKRFGSLTAHISLPLTFSWMNSLFISRQIQCILFQDCGTQLYFMLGGYTSKLQVLDIGVNKPFKNYVKYRNEYFRFEDESARWVKRTDVSKWIDEPWKRVSK